ncbi:MAG: DUF362 domain-containing protein [Candidatus Pacearchaeota archaeon]
MAKGVSIKFRSYSETIPRLLELINLSKELKKYSKIVLKPYLREAEGEKTLSTPVAFVEQVLRFCIKNKSPVAEIFIAEGADGADTMELFNKLGYTKLAERYSVGLIDLNMAEAEPIRQPDFMKFSEIIYPKILKDSFVISLPVLLPDEEAGFIGALSNMLGAFPSKYYKGFFSKRKSKIRKWAIKYSIHDILKCKMPDFTIIDSSEKGVILAGIPHDTDKQAAKLLGLDWKDVGYLRLVEENFLEKPKEQKSEEIPNVLSS